MLRGSSHLEANCIWSGLPLDHELQEVDQYVVEGQHHPKLEDSLDAEAIVGHQILEGEEDRYIEDQ